MLEVGEGGLFALEVSRVWQVLEPEHLPFPVPLAPRRCIAAPEVPWACKWPEAGGRPIRLRPGGMLCLPRRDLATRPHERRAWLRPRCPRAEGALPA